MVWQAGTWESKDGWRPHQKALADKANCKVEDLEKPGIYTFTYVPKNQRYIGKAERQPLWKRLAQHVNISISDRDLTGEFSPLLRCYYHENNWKLQVEPLERDKVAVAERLSFKVQQPELNVQQK